MEGGVRVTTACSYSALRRQCQTSASPPSLPPRARWRGACAFALSAFFLGFSFLRVCVSTGTVMCTGPAAALLCHPPACSPQHSSLVHPSPLLPPHLPPRLCSHSKTVCTRAARTCHSAPLLHLVCLAISALLSPPLLRTLPPPHLVRVLKRVVVVACRSPPPPSFLLSAPAFPTPVAAGVASLPARVGTARSCFVPSLSLFFLLPPCAASTPVPCEHHRTRTHTPTHTSSSAPSLLLSMAPRELGPVHGIEWVEVCVTARHACLPPAPHHRLLLLPPRWEEMTTNLAADASVHDAAP